MRAMRAIMDQNPSKIESKSIKIESKSIKIESKSNPNPNPSPNQKLIARKS